MDIFLEETFVSNRTSCTRDEAAAKLIGWMQGSQRLRNIRLRDGCIAEEQLPYLDRLEEPLTKMLEDYREAARNRLLDAAENNGNIHEHYVALEKYGPLLDLALRYLADIDAEIAKGSDSVLQIDEAATEASDAIHITLTSLDTWSRERYAIDILPSIDSPIATAKKKSDSGSTVQVIPRRKQRIQEDVILDTIRSLGYDPKKLPKDLPGKAGVTAKTRAALKNNTLFGTRRVFDKAWERLSRDGDIVKPK